MKYTQDYIDMLRRDAGRYGLTGSDVTLFVSLSLQADGLEQDMEYRPLTASEDAAYRHCLNELRMLQSRMCYS